MKLDWLNKSVSVGIMFIMYKLYLKGMVKMEEKVLLEVGCDKETKRMLVIIFTLFEIVCGVLVVSIRAFSVKICMIVIMVLLLILFFNTLMRLKRIKLLITEKYLIYTGMSKTIIFILISDITSVLKIYGDYAVQIGTSSLRTRFTNIDKKDEVFEVITALLKNKNERG